MDLKRFDSSEGNVWKYVFTKADMVAEAVLYRFGNHVSFRGDIDRKSVV